MSIAGSRRLRSRVRAGPASATAGPCRPQVLIAAAYGDGAVLVGFGDGGGVVLVGVGEGLIVLVTVGAGLPLPLLLGDGDGEALDGEGMIVE
jgi:hypothetical protein